MRHQKRSESTCSLFYFHLLPSLTKTSRYDWVDDKIFTKCLIITNYGGKRKLKKRGISLYFSVGLLPWYRKNKHCYLIRRPISRNIMLSNATPINKMQFPPLSAPIPNKQWGYTESQWYAYIDIYYFYQYGCQNILLISFIFMHFIISFNYHLNIIWPGVSIATN